MKRILLMLLLALGFYAEAQVYNNEWIDYNKTYYKFKVGKTGLYRISQSVLASAGLSTVPAEQFQHLASLHHHQWFGRGAKYVGFLRHQHRPRDWVAR